jgi:hypothetical protein
VSLRRQNPKGENRGLRRGALQLLAKNGASTATLLAFSGHQSVPMLKLYLGFGTLLRDENRQTRAEVRKVLSSGAATS